MRSLRSVVERCSNLRGYPVVPYFRRTAHEGLKAAAGKGVFAAAAMLSPASRETSRQLLLNINFAELQVHAPSGSGRHS